MPPWQYLVVLKDGRMGWVYIAARIEGATETSLVRMIDAQSAPGPMTPGWHTAKVVKGDITEFQERFPPHYYWFSVVEQVASCGSYFPHATPGDFLMGEQ
jgi:hypothetical protein